MVGSWHKLLPPPGARAGGSAQSPLESPLCKATVNPSSLESHCHPGLPQATGKGSPHTEGQANASEQEEALEAGRTLTKWPGPSSKNQHLDLTTDFRKYPERRPTVGATPGTVTGKSQNAGKPPRMTDPDERTAKTPRKKTRKGEDKMKKQWKTVEAVSQGHT